LFVQLVYKAILTHFLCLNKNSLYDPILNASQVAGGPTDQRLALQNQYQQTLGLNTRFNLNSSNLVQQSQPQHTQSSQQAQANSFINSQSSAQAANGLGQQTANGSNQASSGLTHQQVAGAGVVTAANAGQANASNSASSISQPQYYLTAGNHGSVQALQ
jgi:hypothetical protein